MAPTTSGIARLRPFVRPCGCAGCGIVLTDGGNWVEAGGASGVGGSGDIEGGGIAGSDGWDGLTRLLSGGPESTAGRFGGSTGIVEFGCSSSAGGRTFSQIRSPDSKRGFDNRSLGGAEGISPVFDSDRGPVDGCIATGLSLKANCFDRETSTEPGKMGDPHLSQNLAPPGICAPQDWQTGCEVITSAPYAEV